VAAFCFAPHSPFFEIALVLVRFDQIASVSDYVPAEFSEKPVATRVDEVKGERFIQGLDFKEKLIVAIDKLLVFEQAGVGVNEYTAGQPILLHVESKDQRELLLGSRVTG
jgi:hypothetical protein